MIDEIITEVINDLIVAEPIKAVQLKDGTFVTEKLAKEIEKEQSRKTAHFVH